MKATLEHLVQRCHGDDRPDCPIIDSLAQEQPQGSRRATPLPAQPRRPTFQATNRR